MERKVCDRRREAFANIYIYTSLKQRNNPTIENTCEFLTGRRITPIGLNIGPFPAN